MNSSVVVQKQTDIALVVERARRLLTEGDVMAARMLASGAYDQAKAAAGFAKRFQAGTELIGKAHQLQGDALFIESQAKVRLADEFDAAQKRGEVQSPGGARNFIIPVKKNEIPSVSDFGINPKDIHEARKLRDAEREAPGIVERAIAARLAAGLEPSRANLRVHIGTKTATREERAQNLYETPVEAMRTLLALERFHAAPGILEPACGKGAILRPLEDAGYDVAISDLIDYGTATKDGECQGVADFLSSSPASRAALQVARASEEPRDIVTNPPYGDVLNAFVAHALRVHRPRKMALLLNLNFLCGFEDPDRCFAMDENRPARVYVFSRRLPMMHRDGWDGPQASSSMNTAWFVWELDRHGRYAGPTIINRVDWKDYQDRPALPALLRASAKAANCDIVDALIDAEAARVVAERKPRGRKKAVPA
ncbi:MAG: SAM-dependent methyltransferase [Rhizobiaceae bacterium]|nr:SAM-dependent methyltransferase [Rhizobiaceae bacterium]